MTNDFNDDLNQPKMPDMPDDLPDEVKEAADHFFKAVTKAAGKKAQEVLSACPDDELMKRANKQTMDALISAVNLGSQIIGAMTIIYPNVDAEQLMRLHVQWQCAMLDSMNCDRAGATEDDVLNVERNTMKEFVDTHISGKHMGCILDEVHRRNSWDDLVFDDTEGGASC